MLPETCKMCGKLAYTSDIVIISTEEYASLLKYAGKHRSIYKKNRSRKSKIERDKEVAQFVLEADAVGKSGVEILANCHERFVSARIPSQSSLSRFLLRHRNPFLPNYKEVFKSC